MEAARTWFEIDGDEQPRNGADEPFVSFWPADHFEAAHVHQGPKTGDQIQVALQLPCSFAQLCFVHPFLVLSGTETAFLVAHGPGTRFQAGLDPPVSDHAGSDGVDGLVQHVNNLLLPAPG